MDECALGTHNCSGSKVVCLNQHGGNPGFLCTCIPGYELVNGVCKDVNECTLGTSDCHQNAACTNTNGSFSCACKRGYFGDGLLDCSDGSLKRCVATIEIEMVTAIGNNCWAVLDNNTALGGGKPFYCDKDAGTQNDLYFRVFWLEVQSWSEEIIVTGGLSAGKTKRITELGLDWSGKPGLIQYRVSEADAWHPAKVRVRPFGNSFWYEPADANLCWVDGDACNGEVCYSQSGCGQRIEPSYTYDFDECALGTHACDTNASCTNEFGKYNCTCQVGFYGTGTNLIVGSGTKCVLCPEGKYAQKTGQSSCDACPRFTTGPAGSTSGLNCFCKAGYYGQIVTLQSTCEACPTSTYCPGGQLSYTCPVGSWSPALSTALTDCICMPGWYGPVGGPCQKCRAGYRCEGGWQPEIACPAGMYSPPVSSECFTCGNNSQSTQSSLTCQCNPGYFDTHYFGTFTSGTCETNACLLTLGTTTAGSQICEKAALILNYSYTPDLPESPAYTSQSCAVTNGSVYRGSYSAANQCTQQDACLCKSCSAAQCQICPQSSYSVKGSFECLNCPVNAYSPAGTGVLTECKCLEGFSGNITTVSDTCTPCALGTYAEKKGMATCLSCPVNTYANETGRSLCYDCPYLMISAVGSTNISDCACKPGTTVDVDGQCLNVDECTTAGHNCDAQAVCTDTPGSFLCACNAGTFGGGTTCQVCACVHDDMHVCVSVCVRVCGHMHVCIVADCWRHLETCMCVCIYIYIYTCL